MPTKKQTTTRKKAPSKPKGKPGRPRAFVLDPTLHRRIVDLIRAGNYPEVAAASVGITKETFFRWIKEGSRLRSIVDGQGYIPRGHEVDLVRFSHDVEQAIGQSEVHDVLAIHSAAKTDWRAAAHRLERRHRSRWAKDNVEAGRHAFDGGDDDSLDNAVEALASALDAMAARRTR